MSTDDPFIDSFNSKQSTIMTLRRIQLSFGCLVLGGIVASIIKRRLYVYNTTKLFMFCCICYLIGMLVVLLHFESFTAGYKFDYGEIQEKSTRDPGHYIYHILNKMKQNKSDLFFCGFEAFINLFFYNFGYFFAALVSYNVYCVITDNYRNFMKNRLKSPKIWAILIIMLLIYALPFLLIYIQEFTQSEYFYSYGPSGFPARVNIQGIDQTAELLLFCGVNSNSDVLPTALSLINIYIFPLAMLLYHCLLLVFNQSKIKQLVDDENYLNSKQQFLIKSGRISIIVFCIQFLNFLKLLIDLLFSKVQTLLLVLNFIFDFYPLLLLYFFWRYTRQKKGIQHGSSTILNQTQTSE